MEAPVTREEFEALMQKEREAEERLNQRRVEWNARLQDLLAIRRAISREIVATAADRPGGADPALLARYEDAKNKVREHCNNPPMPEPVG